MSYVSHDGLAYFKHKLDQKFISNITSEDGALKIVLGDGTVLKSIQDTTVTQKKSTANELYPLLLCYDAMANQDQLSKETWFGQHILANPYYGYLASRGMYVKHPTFNRRNGVSQKVEWAYDFTDAVSGLGNPMSQVYAYVDPASEGGEHCIELRLYGNPNVSPTVPSINDSTNTFSIGVGVTGGNVQFGYCPSTPLYLDDGSTLRTEATGHGNDIITRDWLNRNGSLTGLVHTTMNETIDGAKTFKKTVTINSGDNNNKAGLTVQGNTSIGGNSTVAGNSSISGNETVGGTLTSTGKFTANGTAEIKGGSGNNPSLTVTGNEKVTGNSTVDGNSSVGGNISTTNGNISTTNGTVSGKTGSIGSGGLTVAGNETVTGKITGNGGAEISGGNGLKVNGNETVTGNISATGNITTNGTITKVVNNTPVEYVTYVTSQPETREALSENILALGKGLNKDSTGKIYVDFSQIDANTKAAILAGLNIQVPISSNMILYVNPGADNDTDDQTLQFSTRIATPFTTIQGAVNWAADKLAINSHNVSIKVYPGTYVESVYLPAMNRSSGIISIEPQSGNKDVIIRPSNSNNTALPDFCFTTSAGPSVWLLHKLTCIVDLSNNNRPDATSGCYRAGHEGAQINIRNCDAIVLPVASSLSGIPYSIRVFDASDGGILIFQPSDGDGSVKCAFPENNDNGIVDTISVLHASRSGIIKFIRSRTGNFGDYKCEGSCSYFINMWQNGSMAIGGAGTTQAKFVLADNKTLTGKKYWLRTGAYGVSPAPSLGTTEGTVDTSTYCWFNEPSS